MARPRVPEELKEGPFTLEAARAAGLTRAQLAGKSWIRLARGIYIWRALALDPEIALRAALHRTPPNAVFSGATAAWLHGFTGERPSRIEMTIPNGHGVSTRVGMSIARRYLEPEDVVTVGVYRATSICRTLLDLSWRLGLVESVVLIDAALHAGLVDLSYLRTWVAIRRGLGGTARLRAALEHAEPLAESPMETRLRMLLVRRGLPRPQAQVEIAGTHGEFAGRIDLYYPEARLGLEYDGATHRESLAEDNRRQNQLLRAGVRLLRFTAGDIYQRPDEVAAQVAGQLRLRPAA